MRRRTFLGASAGMLGGCVSVSTKSGGADGNAPSGDSAGPETAIPVGGGGLGGGDIDAIEAEIISTINSRRRTIDDAPPLSATGTFAERLRAAASAHSKAMATTGVVSRDVDNSPLLDTLEDANCSIGHDTMVHTFSDGETAIVDSIGIEGRGADSIAETLVDRWLDTNLVRGLVLADQADIAVAEAELRGSTLLATVIFC